jgi:hypothetical protein
MEFHPLAVGIDEIEEHGFLLPPITLSWPIPISKETHSRKTQRDAQFILLVGGRA